MHQALDTVVHAHEGTEGDQLADLAVEDMPYAEAPRELLEGVGLCSA